VAPDLAGTDSAGRALRLSECSGKVVILLFWHNAMPEAEHAIELTNAMVRKFQGKSAVVLGVNCDSLEKLRSLEADGTVNWRSFSDPKNQLARDYRIGVWPLVFVLDGERKVQYAGAPGSFAELTADALLAEKQPAASR
jgi:peroxiredoxin